MVYVIYKDKPARVMQIIEKEKRAEIKFITGNTNPFFVNLSEIFPIHKTNQQ